LKLTEVLLGHGKPAMRRTGDVIMLHKVTPLGSRDARRTRVPPIVARSKAAHENNILADQNKRAKHGSLMCAVTIIKKMREL
jgi:hypothetical protein